MGRIRTIKPEFFKHEALYELEMETGLPIRVAYAGIWTCCDREGRFKWRPRSLKSEILPYDEIDFSRVLDALATRGFLVRYRVAGEDYGHVPTFPEHQFINNREQLSTIPDPSKNEGFDASATREERDDDARSTRLEGKGKEGEVGREGEVRVNAPPRILQQYADIWNKKSGSLPKVEKLTPGRQRKLAARVKAGLETPRFERAVECCASKPFLSGVNDRGWTATFDWLIENDTNIQKAIENPYGSEKNSSNGWSPSAERYAPRPH